MEKGNSKLTQLSTRMENMALSPKEMKHIKGGEGEDDKINPPTPKK
jgi:hypothetical protein